MQFEIDSDIAGATLLLVALAKLNLHDARRNAKVAAELIRRCTQAPKSGFLYASDPAATDRWSSFIPLLGRTRPDEPIQADCEDQTAAYAAACVLIDPLCVVEVAITQPAPGSMAHAYCLLNGQVFDPSAWNGMKPPPESFYLSGETARFQIN